MNWSTKKNIEIDYNFWDYMNSEIVTYVARIFAEGYTVADYLDFE